MDRFVIIEIEHEKVFKVATVSYRYVSDTPLFMLLAERYHIGPEGRTEIRFNKFSSFVQAEKAIGELMRCMLEDCSLELDKGE